MRLGDYLSAILQDFTRAKMQADVFARDLARDIADTPEQGEVPVTRFSFDQSTITTRVAVKEATTGKAGGPGKKELTAAASQTANSLPDEKETAELFALSDQAGTVWREEYVPRVKESFQQGLTGELSPSAAASLVEAVVVKVYTQFLVDERVEASDSDRNRILRGGQIGKLESVVRERYREQLEKRSKPIRSEEDTLGAHVEVLVGIEELADIEDRLLTTLEITLEGETVRWETIDDDRGELIQL